VTGQQARKKKGSPGRKGGKGEKGLVTGTWEKKAEYERKRTEGISEEPRTAVGSNGKEGKTLPGFSGAGEKKYGSMRQKTPRKRNVKKGEEEMKEGTKGKEKEKREIECLA